MKLVSTLPALLLSASAALSAPVNPDFFFTAFDQGNNGFGVPALSTPSHPIAQQNDFTINFTVSTILLRGSPGPATADRKSYAFVQFDLPGITSVSSAFLSFQNSGSFFLNTSGFPAAAPEIAVKSAIESSYGVAQIAALIAGAGEARTTFQTASPLSTTYNLDVTTLINAALDARGATAQRVNLIFENNEDFASLPNDVSNGGYGNIGFTAFSLNAVEGPAPTAPVPLPAGLSLLIGALAAFGVAKRRARQG